MPEEVRQLHVSLATAEAEITRLRELLATVGRLHATGEQHLADLLASEAALAQSQAETKEGQADLPASELGLATSRAETKEGQADLLASEWALATSRAGTKEGQADLLASELANKTMILANALLLAGKEALRKSEDRFRRLFEATPIALVIINAAGPFRCRPSSYRTASVLPPWGGISGQRRNPHGVPDVGRASCREAISLPKRREVPSASTSANSPPSAWMRPRPSGATPT
jgi:PAS domain-containing protein